jgi:mRNA interferase RelE/StbE
MAWKIEFERAAARELDKLGSQSAGLILRFLRDRLLRSLTPVRSVSR